MPARLAEPACQGVSPIPHACGVRETEEQRGASPVPQVLFFIDEVHSYLPPVRKPVCKDALSLLFREGRKHGLACLAATQSPGDLDYKALGQISTWDLGRLIMPQEIKKVEGHLKALAPTGVDEIVSRLPALVPGRSILFSPDVARPVIDLETRWLVSQHKKLDEKGIAGATEAGLRHRLETALEARKKPGWRNQTTRPPMTWPGRRSARRRLPGWE
jgi:hypothetical protein